MLITRTGSFWRLMGVGLAVSLCFAGSGQQGAMADPGGDDSKSDPGRISTQPLFPADDGPQPTLAQAELAAKLSAIQTNGGSDPLSKHTPPPQVSQGVLGVSGSPAKGYVVTLAKDMSAMQAESSLFSGLSKGAMGSLTMRVSEVTVGEITEVWDAVVSEGWVAEPDGGRPTYSAGIEDGQVVVKLSTTASDASRKRLAAVSRLVRVVDIAPITSWSR